MFTDAHKKKTLSRIHIVFSDVDGTLVHYPSLNSTQKNDNDELLYLPPSSTGMKGVISYNTLSLCTEIRRKSVRLVLVSGMRTTTLISRLPFLPVADAYCSEGGGRIFYPIPLHSHKNDDDKMIIYPKDGKSPPYQLMEDMHWRKLMEQENAAGSQGYESQEKHLYKIDFDLRTDKLEQPRKIAPMEQRSGLLWDFARNLFEQGWILDTKGYATNFRINLKKQTSDKLISNPDFFQDLPNQVPKGINCSVNLGCIDFYPAASGKKNCCEYLVQKYGSEESTEIKETHQNETNSQKRWVCLCDDDNDIEMAMYCHHAYIPSVTSESMENIISTHPNHFTVTCDEQLKRKETYATEHALQLIFDTLDK